MSDFEVEFNLNKENPIEADFEVQDIQPIDVELTLDSAADKHFVFEQEIPSDTWQITHNLEKRPSVTVVDSAGNMQMPDEVTYNDDNTITIKFVGSFAGKAFLN